MPAALQDIQRKFRSACGLFPTGVTILTRVLSGGEPYGMTVSSFTSVSLDPMLVLVCVDARTRFLKELAEGSILAINFLNEDQQHLAVRFSSRQDANRFAGVPCESEAGEVPLLSGAVARLVCRLQSRLPAGDHEIILAAVDDIHLLEGHPLVWCASDYHCLPRRPSATEEMSGPA